MQHFKDLATKTKQVIKFKSIISGNTVEFPAFITKFDDSYTVSWGGSAPIFGRTDPIKNYQSTSRRISVAFDILGESYESAKENFVNFSNLIKMLYPVYSEKIKKENNARTIRGAPLIRIKYVNYIYNPEQPDGLLGCVGGFNFSPDFNAGHFSDGDNGDLLPLKYSLSFTFEPIHEKPLGAEVGDPATFLQETFPYNQPAEFTRTTTPARRIS